MTYSLIAAEHQMSIQDQFLNIVTDLQVQMKKDQERDNKLIQLLVEELAHKKAKRD